LARSVAREWEPIAPEIEVMDTVLLLARLLLAGVFVVAGGAKLADRKGSKAALEGFGLPPSIAAKGGYALPVVELVVGILLIPRATAPYAAIAAFLLLLSFVAGIAYNLSKGRTPDCHCFGQLHSEPVGTSTLVRNGVLAVVALFVAIAGWDDPGPSLVAWIGDLSTAEQVVGVVALVALIGVAIEAWLVIHLVSQNGRILLRIDSLEALLGQQPASQPAAAQPVGLAEGTVAPAFSLKDVYEQNVSLDSLRASGNPVLLIFSDPGCGPCNSLLPDIGKWQRDHRDRINVALVSRGSVDANKSKAEEHGLSSVLIQQDREVARSYQGAGTPSGIIVTADGKIGSPIAQGAEAIRQLVARTTGAAYVPTAAPQAGNGLAAKPAGPTVGDSAPEISLPDIDGKNVQLSDFSDQETLVLFWNPGCGFCSRMLPDLQEWIAKRGDGEPALLVVSRGGAEENRKQGIEAPILLDQGFAAGRAFGATGTPAAVLVSESGLIASPVVAGATAVLALARGGAPKDPAKSS
jgi:peroxiredoxin/uncharacterized membrane protein YphA (DoxX/SURF4 family)